MMLPSAYKSKRQHDKRPNHKRPHTALSSSAKGLSTTAIHGHSVETIDAQIEKSQWPISMHKRRRLTSRSSKPTSKQDSKDLLSSFLLRNEPICTEICSYLTPHDFNRVANTSKRLRTRLSEGRWDINRRLARFFNKPDAFRNCMRETSSLIAGDFALQFFQGVTRLESTLDIFVERAERYCDLHIHLCFQERYTPTESRRKAVEAEKEICRVTTFTRESTQYGSVQLRVHLTNEIPLQAVLNNCYVTATANIITWDRAYSLFPFPTFVTHKMYMLKPLDEIFARDLRVYRRDGWKLDDIIRPAGDVLEDGDLYAPKLPACMTQDRRIGDRHCWIITFDNASQSDSEKDSDLFLDASGFERNTFRVSSRFECDDYIPTCFPLSDIGIIRHELLRFRYTYARGDWAHTLKDRLEDMLGFELATMAEAYRPEGTLVEACSQYGNQTPMLSLTMHDDFERNREDPVVLRGIIEYADHLLHKWYEEFIVKVPNYNDDPVTHRPHVYLGH